MIIRKHFQYVVKISMRNFSKPRQYATLKIKQFILVGCGNPLLDISANVDLKLLQKYELAEDHAHLAEPQHKTLYEELVRDYQVEYKAGGAVQNSLRVCQWILQQPYSTVFFGCVGNDSYSKVLADSANKEGVCTRYQYKDELPTGTCAVLITGTKRTLVANLAAAQAFTVEHLEKPENKVFLENAEYFYTSGYLLTVSLKSILKIAQHACTCNHPFIFNLAADYICDSYMDYLEKIMAYVDILVGNELEIYAYANKNDWKTNDFKEIGRKIQSSFKLNLNRSRIVIITQGPAPILVVQKDSIQEYKIPDFDVKNIVDTNGAGDAFVGGFLAQYMQRKSLGICINCGIYAAQHTLSQIGCTLSGKPTFEE